MSGPVLFSSDRLTVIAALHLPPLPGSRHPAAQPVAAAVDYALRNAERAVRAGITALYIQDVADTPVAPEPQPHTVAGLSVVGAALRKAFPDLTLGVCMISHGAREPLAVAQAMGAQFVRIKVYVGAMVKAEGLQQGCAYEAVQYRARLGAEEILILADVYDRTGQPLGRMPLVEEARQAAVFGRADALILTGASLDKSLEMLQEVRAAGLGVPLLLGGGASSANIARVLLTVDAVIVSSTFKKTGGWTRESLLEEWDEGRIQQFMQSLPAKNT